MLGASLMSTCCCGPTACGDVLCDTGLWPTSFTVQVFGISGYWKPPNCDPCGVENFASIGWPAIVTQYWSWNPNGAWPCWYYGMYTGGTQSEFHPSWQYGACFDQCSPPTHPINVNAPLMGCFDNMTNEWGTPFVMDMFYAWGGGSQTRMLMRFPFRMNATTGPIPGDYPMVCFDSQPACPFVTNYDFLCDFWDGECEVDADPANIFMRIT